MCQAARDSVAHLDWSHVIGSNVSAYEDLQKIQPTISDDERDMLTSLATFLSMGDVRDYLLDVIDGPRQNSTTKAYLLPRTKVPSLVRHWTRVPSSTWILSGLTILISAMVTCF